MLHCLCCCCHNSYKRSRVAREKERTLEGIAAGFIAFLPVQLLSRSFSPALYYYYYVFLSRVTLSKLGENTGRALRYDQKSFLNDAAAALTSNTLKMATHPTSEDPTPTFPIYHTYLSMYPNCLIEVIAHKHTFGNTFQ